MGGRDGGGRAPSNSLEPPIADFFASLNEEGLHKLAGKSYSPGDKPFVISCSHFVPYLELFPGVAQFRHVMGCAAIAKQVLRAGSRVHLFGHSHVNVDSMIEGVRFVQRARGDAKEHAESEHSPACQPVLLWAA